MIFVMFMPSMQPIKLHILGYFGVHCYFKL